MASGLYGTAIQHTQNKPAADKPAQIPWPQEMQRTLSRQIEELDKTFDLRMGPYARVSARRITAVEAAKHTRETLGPAIAADAKARYQALSLEFEQDWRGLLELHAAEIAQNGGSNSTRHHHTREIAFLKRLQEAAMPRLPNPLELGELAGSKLEKLPLWLNQPDISAAKISPDPTSAARKVAIAVAWIALNAPGVGKAGTLIAQLVAIRPHLNGRPLLTMARIAAEDEAKIAFPSAAELARCKSIKATKGIASLFDTLNRGPANGKMEPRVRGPER